MESFPLPLAAWLAGALGLMAAGGLVARLTRARASASPLALAAGGAGEAPGEVQGGGQIRRIELRMEAMEGLQAEFLARVETLGNDEAAERRLQAMASRILGLVRDKDATLDTALAGLDQLRARLRVLEQMGDIAEARGLFERQAARLEAAEAKLAGLEAATPPFAEISEQMSRLYGQRDAMAETVFARLAPLEAKQRELEATVALRDPQAALDRLAERLEAVRAAQEAAATALGDRLAGRLDGVAAGAEARLDALAAAQAAAEAALAARLAALEEAPDATAEIAERLAGLHDRKEAATEAVLGRLAPLEARLGDLETRLAASHPGAELERLAERLEAVRAAQEATGALLGGRLDGVAAATEARLDGLTTTTEARLDGLATITEARLLGLASETGTRLDGIAALQAAAEAALAVRLAALEGAPDAGAQIAERLAALHAQKEAAAAALLGRLAPLETKLSELETALAARDPQGALDLLAERLEAVRAAQAAETAALGDRVAGRIDTVAAGAEAGLDRLEATTGARLDGLAAAQAAAEAALAARLGALEGAPNAAAEIGERLAALHAQKDAGVEAALGRLAPLEAQLAELAGVLAACDPATAFERIDLRLEAALAATEIRLAALEQAAREDTGAEAEAEAARMQAQAIAVQLVAARTVAEETRLFANRLALLEASLPRLSMAQALMMQALERQSSPQTAAWPLAEEAPLRGGEEEDAAWRLPRVISGQKT
jgi:hypothetical protein